jgi:glycosyltransferase involved in cell wall biosynthesis
VRGIDRMFSPHMHLEGSRFLFNPVRTRVEEMSDADIVVVQRQAGKANLLSLQQMKNMGLKIVYDLDDDLWSISGSSPAKKLFEPVREQFGVCMELCDVITVSTEPLQTAVRTAVPVARTKPIFVVPNGVDFNFLHPAALPKPKGRVTVGWGGSNTHAGDVADAWQVLPKILDELPQLYLEFVGMLPPKPIIGHPRVKLREYCPIGEFVSRFPSWGWDITLAPLQDIRFNRSKSSIKMTEAAAINAVCLVSDVGPYRRFCDLNPGLSWLLCRKPQDWYDKLKALVLDAELRATMALQVRKTAEEHFEQSKLMPLWREAFSAAMG